MKKRELTRYAVPCVILAVGIAFVVLGIADSECAAVLKKAINICLECIGLG